MSYKEMSEADQAGFAGHMRRFREKYGLSQRELALAMGVGVGTVAGLEVSRVRPWPETVLKFQKVEARYRAVEEKKMDELQGMS